MGQIPQWTDEHCHFPQTTHRNTPNQHPHPQIAVEYLVHFQRNLGFTSPCKPQVHCLLYPFGAQPLRQLKILGR